MKETIYLTRDNWGIRLWGGDEPYWDSHTNSYITDGGADSDSVEISQWMAARFIDRLLLDGEIVKVEVEEKCPTMYFDSVARKWIMREEV